MQSIIARLSEPSTHAGIAALAQVAKPFLPPPYNLLCDCLSTLFAGAAIATPERK